MDSLDNLEEKIALALPKDRRFFHGRLRSMRRAAKAGKPFDRNLGKFQQDLEGSLEQWRLRQDSVPQVSYAGDLPIHARVDEIITTIRDNSVTIVCGETGSGKSTQLPKICLEAGRGVAGTIGHTQPRRIAARSIATRLAEELKVPLGNQVGFKVRFTDVTKPTTHVKLMTDGILLAETQGDRLLESYDTIIIDEAHERSLNIDLLLGYLKTILPRRPDLRVIVTSATIDVDRYREFFTTDDGPAPLISVEGRTYPVDVRYQPPEETGEERREPDPLTNLVTAIEDLCSESFGDSLVFVPTERDIREVARLLRGRTLPGDHAGATSEILPLYGRLSAAEQSRVFQPHPHRRIVIATNVAESSITVPNIRYVVDSGTARISRYSARSGVQRLPIEPIAQASADQRAGRCGRVGPGICVRLYSQEDYESREAYTPPEIQRTNLAAVILQLKTLGLGEIDGFPLLDPPKPGTIRDGYDTLFELGALDEQRELTNIGRQLAKLPVDPRVGRMVLAGHEERCLREVLIIAAALELQDPRERPLEHQQAADQAQRRFLSAESDFISYLKLWKFIKEQQRQLSRSQLRKMCQKVFLSYNRLREWQDIHRQLVQLADEAKLNRGAGIELLERLDEDEGTADGEQQNQRGRGGRRRRHDRTLTEAYDALHRALLTGLLSNIALKKDESNEYTGSGGQTLRLWPGSGLIEQKPKWVIAAELIETRARYARCAARINPKWIEPLAPHLVKRSYGDPRWNGASGRVLADERVALFGLPIVPRRSANYGPLDPGAARTLFIQNGLVEGDWENPPAFYRQNRELIAEIEEFLSKTRRLDLLRGEAAHFAFYDQRLPEEVYDGPTLSRWIKQAPRDSALGLRLRKSDLVRDEAENVAESDFPAEIDSGGIRLPLEYQLEPGTEDDGVTVVVPQAALGQLSPDRLSWLVPGLLEEKVAALIRSLPKPVRTAFVPVPQTTREIAPQITFGKGDLETTLAGLLSRMAGELIEPAMFAADRLPNHLRMNVRVVDDEGNTISTGRDLAELSRHHGTAGAVSPQNDAMASQWHRDGLTDWVWNNLPESIPLQRGDTMFPSYPTIVDQETAVGLRLFDSSDRAVDESQRGLRRLFLLGNRKAIRAQVDWLPELDRNLLNLSTLIAPGLLRGQLVELMAARALTNTGLPLSRTEAEYREMLKRGRNQISVAAQDIQSLLGPLADRWQAVKLWLERRHPPQWQPALDDVRSQIEHLFPPDFLLRTRWEWLAQYPRYLKAIVLRIEKLSAGGLERDRRLMADIAPHWRAYLDKRHTLTDGASAAKLDRFHGMIEEYRVSLFAQTLGTSITISAKRLEKAAARIK